MVHFVSMLGFYMKKQAQIFLEIFVEFVVEINVGRIGKHVQILYGIGEQVAKDRIVTADLFAVTELNNEEI